MLPLLVQRGAAATSRELAKAAGVAEGTIWKVFRDKQDLVATAVERAIDPTSFDQAVAGLDESLPFEDRLVAMTDLMQRRMVDIWRLLQQTDVDVPSLSAGRFPDNETVIALFAREPQRIRVPAVEAARLLRALVVSLSNPRLMEPPFDAAGIVEMFLHGVAAESDR